MTDAAKILKGYRNHRRLDDVFDAEGNLVEAGASSTAQSLCEEHERPVYVNEQTSKTITTSDGRVRTTFAGFYLSLSKGSQTIEDHIPEGYVAPEPEETGRLAKEQRDAVAQAAKTALADVAEALIEEYGADHDEQVRSMLATWARRIPGEAWDNRLGEGPEA